MTLPFNQP